MPGKCSQRATQNAVLSTLFVGTDPHHAPTKVCAVNRGERDHIAGRQPTHGVGKTAFCVARCEHLPGMFFLLVTLLCQERRGDYLKLVHPWTPPFSPSVVIPTQSVVILTRDLSATRDISP